MWLNVLSCCVTVIMLRIRMWRWPMRIRSFITTRRSRQPIQVIQRNSWPCTNDDDYYYDFLVLKTYHLSHCSSPTKNLHDWWWETWKEEVLTDKQADLVSLKADLKGEDPADFILSLKTATQPWFSSEAHTEEDSTRGLHTSTRFPLYGWIYSLFLLWRHTHTWTCSVQ